MIPVKLSPSAPAAILADHQIKTAGAHLNEREALAKGMTQIQALYGGIPEFASNVVFTFEERTGYSRYEGLRNGKHQIAMNRCNSKGRGCAANNVAHLMHELGHRVGHAAFSGRETFYSAYERRGGDCQPTTYSKTNKHEEFAEVFAAFLTHPELLSGGSPGCQRAYEFLARDVFTRNGRLASCEPAAKEELMARAQILPEGDTRVASNDRQTTTKASTKPKQPKRTQKTKEPEFILSTLWGQSPAKRTTRAVRTDWSDEEEESLW